MLKSTNNTDIWKVREVCRKKSILLAYIHNRSGFDVDGGWRSWKEISADQLSSLRLIVVFFSTLQKNVQDIALNQATMSIYSELLIVSLDKPQINK
jgi:hypothetical protein